MLFFISGPNDENLFKTLSNLIFLISNSQIAKWNIWDTIPPNGKGMFFLYSFFITNFNEIQDWWDFSANWLVWREIWPFSYISKLGRGFNTFALTTKDKLTYHWVTRKNCLPLSRLLMIRSPRLYNPAKNVSVTSSNFATFPNPWFNTCYQETCSLNKCYHSLYIGIRHSSTILPIEFGDCHAINTWHASFDLIILALSCGTIWARMCRRVTTCTSLKKTLVDRLYSCYMKI